MKLDSSFEADLAEALLADIADKLPGAGSPVMTAIQASNDKLRDSEYDGADSVAESLSGPIIEHHDDRVTVSWGWEHEAAKYFEFGTSDHQIDGNPILSFIWEDPPQWVRNEFEQARSSGGQFKTGWRVFLASVEVSGIDEVRFTRHGLRVLRRELGAY